MGNRNSTAIRGCLDAICSNSSACVTYPDEPLFAWWAKPFNLEFPVIPAAIIRPENTIEVAETVRCAREHGFKVQAKSGGHSYGWVIYKNHGQG
jgi:FAD/FMN-containing dehydrogenase